MIHPPTGPEWLVSIETSALATAMREWLWLYPAVEISHILGFVILVGSVVMFDLRVLGFTRSLPLTAMERHLLPWAWASLLIVIPAGLMMFSAHATEFANNPAFRLKLILLITAAINVAWFHRGPFRSVGAWDTQLPAPTSAKISAALSIALWVGVISCGRLLAYF